MGEWKCKLQGGVGFRGNPNSSVPEIPTGINSSVPEFIENIDSEMPFPNRYEVPESRFASYCKLLMSHFRKNKIHIDDSLFNY